MNSEIKTYWTDTCTKDDTVAFKRLYHAMFNRLMRFSIFYTGEREAAEEIVSEVFVRCWNNRKSLVEVEHPHTYLFVAVKNESLKYRKKISSVHLVEIPESEELKLVDMNDPSLRLERKELRHRLDQAIETLPNQARMVFKLIKENGLKYKEVAEILEISPRTVQTQLFRAIAKLRDVLAAEKPAGTRKNKGNDLINIVLLISISEIILRTCRHFL